MSKTVILQSYNLTAPPEWIQRCMERVAGWAEQQGYDYRVMGDELFDYVPAWYLAKVGDKLPVAADLARLVWLEEVLGEGAYTHAVWMDADTWVIAPDRLRLDTPEDHQFGQEFWLQPKGGGYRVYRNVHNGYCAFRRDSPLLPFLRFAVERLLRQVDAAHIAPQLVGPKLLTSLHNMLTFSLEPRCGALSPSAVAALLEGDKPRWDILSRTLPEPLLAVNLCASLLEQNTAMALLDVLSTYRDGLYELR